MDTLDSSRTNRLADETSPYLLQHAHNPVDWYPWGEEALQRAREEGRLILLSIGYSACHWCHVMAHESFEDAATAAVMNELYVNIKVDREERPDLDRIYQSAHHLLNQRGGGWPLTVILTPDEHIPFFAGTYFPKERKYGMPSFTELLQRVHDFYGEHRDEIEKQNASLLQALDGMDGPHAVDAASINAVPLDQARRQLEGEYDNQYAGFGKAPKFPHPTNLERLLRHWAATASGEAPDKRALDMARVTLHAMASGGIYDQLGGGFCRYSVDEQWMIPHFEKMLYDNGPLLTLYAQAYGATGEAALGRVAVETGEWVMREMQSPEGGYYSTLDADSEGEEGKFYVWSPDAARAVLDKDEYTVAARIYGLDRPANFEGHWHLHVFEALDSVANDLSLEPGQAQQLLASARRKLLEAREARVHPGRDEKILTSWNGLMITGMAAAGRHLGRTDFIDSAQRAVDFIRATLYRDGRLLATYKDGKAHLMAYLDDYAFMLQGLLELLQARWRDTDLQFAMELADTLLESFEDRERGGFYFTAHDHERLIHRPRPFMDEAIPSGNGIAAHTLARLGHLLGEMRYLEAAERTLKAAWHGISSYPHAHGALLLAVEEHLFPPQTIVMRGNIDTLQAWTARCNTDYAPRRMSFAIPPDSELPGLLAERKPQGEAVAYVCTSMRCQAPITDLDGLETALRETTAHTGGAKHNLP
ncbi:MAG: thioredoxin domain-containing protein [Pseudomonadota bacterium]|nr:MAG: thioredoxin domain-containing protein [Pseudomonadota bacterium]